MDEMEKKVGEANQEEKGAAEEKAKTEEEGKTDSILNHNDAESTAGQQTMTNETDDAKAENELNRKNAEESKEKTEGKKEEEKEEEKMDVLGGGELLKKRLKPGKGRHTRPNFGEVCVFNVRTTLPDGTLLDEKKDFRCILGHLEAVQALDLTLMLMEVGETARVTAKSKFTTPKLDFNPQLPPGGADTLVYEVELLDVDPIPNYSIMKSEELSKALLRKKELGNFSISVDDHQTALSTYNFAKEMMEQATDVVEPSLKVAIWNNMAACHLKMQNFAAVVDHANKVLTLQPDNVKALFRKGKALGMKGEYEEALEVLNRGIKVAAEKDLKLFHQAAADFKQKLSKSNEKQKAMYKAMFSPDKPKPEKKRSSGVSWLAVGAAVAVVIAVGAALIKVNLSSS